MDGRQNPLRGPVPDVDRLPLTQYLLMEVLGARWRLGHHIWPFPSTAKQGLRMLEAAGLVNLHSPNANIDAPGWRSPIRASLTDAGRRAILADDYEVPPAPVDGFDFGTALRDVAVRAHIARRGYIHGDLILVGNTTQAETGETRRVFRVWRDPNVPGGWDGRAEPAPKPDCPNCGSPRAVRVSLDEGWSFKAQCVPCGHVRPIGESDLADPQRRPEG